MICFTIIALLFSLFVLGVTIKRVIRRKENILDYAFILFFTVHVVPMFLKIIWGTDQMLRKFSNLYSAMNDKDTWHYYILFIIISDLLFLCFNRFIPHKDLVYNNNILLRVVKKNKFKHKNVLLSILACLMFINIIFAIVAPRPGIYLRFSYFYTQDLILDFETIYTYHKKVLSIGNYISLVSTLLFYRCNDNKKLNILVFISIVNITWLNGKRTLLTFALIGIIVIDFLFKKSDVKKIIYKAAGLAVLLIAYFNVYSMITGKGDNQDFNYKYSLYFSRLPNVCLSIYDNLNENIMLDYTGQTVLYSFLWFVPRFIWPNKPVMFCKYFTAYATNSALMEYKWQLQVNIWSEYIANFGFLGIFLAFLLLYLIAFISYKSSSKIVYFLGLMYVVLYSIYGFEHLVQYISFVWIAVLIWNCLRKRIKMR